ncbi:MAG: hypothetical protein DMG13_27485 [Acidobacteria bacterium]|nr:MAG: hypothetical protein DMG13_27485 [Acidobacteriota bacterium]
MEANAFALKKDGRKRGSILRAMNEVPMVEDVQTMNWKWLQYALILLIGIGGVLVLFIAGCQRSATTYPEEAAVKPSPLKSAEPAEVPPLPTQAAVPARVFEPAIAEIRGQTKLRILLPSKLPAVIHERDIKLALGMVLENGYSISLYYDEEASGASFAATFSGSTDVFRDLPNTQPATLANGIVGIFRPVSCGGSCAPANLWWEKDGVMYQIQIKLLSTMDEQEQQKIMVETADSSVALVLSSSLPQSGLSDIAGTWEVVGHVEPGISAMSNVEADSWLRKKARYENAIAEFGSERCTAPSYTKKLVNAKSYFMDEFRIQASQLGITTNEIAVVEVKCSDADWTAPGSLLLKDQSHLLTVWDGVFFKLSR